MEEKRAKDEEAKRRRMEMDLRDEMRYKEEVEREKLLELEE
jgi:hypothetical protein